MSHVSLERLQFLKENERKIIAAQAFWRGALCRKSYNERLNNLKSHEELWSKVPVVASLITRFKPDTEVKRIDPST